MTEFRAAPRRLTCAIGFMTFEGMSEAQGPQLIYYSTYYVNLIHIYISELL